MKGLSAYQENRVTTQSKGRLVVLLYEGAIKFLRQAIEEIEAGHWAEKGKYISKALAIVDELNTSLDMEAGGEVAANLRRLYEFMTAHLEQANMNRDAEPCREVIRLLEDLNGAWKVVS